MVFVTIHRISKCWCALWPSSLFIDHCTSYVHPPLCSLLNFNRTHTHSRTHSRTLTLLTECYSTCAPVHLLPVLEWLAQSALCGWAHPKCITHCSHGSRTGLLQCLGVCFMHPLCLPILQASTFLGFWTFHGGTCINGALIPQLPILPAVWQAMVHGGANCQL